MPSLNLIGQQKLVKVTVIPFPILGQTSLTWKYQSLKPPIISVKAPFIELGIFFSLFLSH